MSLVALCFFAIGWLAARDADAHPLMPYEVRVEFKADGSYEIFMLVDFYAAVLGRPPGDPLSDEDLDEIAQLEPEKLAKRFEALERYYRIMTSVRFDSEEVAPDVDFPVSQAYQEQGLEMDDLPERDVRLSGAIPEEAAAFTWWSSPVYGPAMLRIQVEGEEPALPQMLGPGEESEPFPLEGVAPRPGVLQIAGRYLTFGFLHILPRGLDHILFVLGLFLLSPKMKPLLWQVTAFTLAHSVSLALSIYDVVSLPPSIVEPLIALSIAYVAVENIVTSELKPWRPAVVFGFGLLHGLGFAGVLSELGLPRSQFLNALLTFNVGVELGQLSVIALAFMAVAGFRNRDWYRRRLVVPASAAIALVGLYWAVERTLG